MSDENFDEKKITPNLNVLRTRGRSKTNFTKPEPEYKRLGLEPVEHNNVERISTTSYADNAYDLGGKYYSGDFEAETVPDPPSENVYQNQESEDYKSNDMSSWSEYILFLKSGDTFAGTYEEVSNKILELYRDGVVEMAEVVLYKKLKVKTGIVFEDV